MSHVEHVICFKGSVGCLRREMNLFPVRTAREVCKTACVAWLCTSLGRKFPFESLMPCVYRQFSTLFSFPAHVTLYTKLTHLRAINTPGTAIKTQYNTFYASRVSG